MKRDLSQVIAKFARLLPVESVRGLFCWIIASAAAGLAEGTIRIRDIDLARIVGFFAGAVQARKEGVDEKKVSCPGPEATRKLVEEVEKALGARRSKPIKSMRLSYYTLTMSFSCFCRISKVFEHAPRNTGTVQTPGNYCSLSEMCIAVHD